jgi:TATA-box binding protein (TBP) (component of TFIID and TFIIIB)
LNLKKGVFLNRDLITNYLSQKNVKFTYDPTSYPGVKFTIEGVKITIFRTGSILFSSKVDISKKALPFIQEMLSKNLETEALPELEEGEELNIWDL